MKKDKQTNEKKKRRIGLKIFLVILFILAIAGCVFAYKVTKNGGGLKGILATTVGHDENTVNTLPNLYCLLLGKSENLTDTIMVAKYDPKTQTASMLSIPRDTFIGEDKNYASAWDKINAVYQTGADNILKEVNELLGMNIDKYVMVDTAALRALVDEIGGVTFDVPIDMDYDSSSQNLHIHLEKGVQKLDGDKAEQLVRFRHNNDGSTYPYEYGIEDIGRMRTQREFLKTLAEQTLRPENILKINSFIDIAKEYVETNLDFDTIKDYIPYAVEFDIDNLKTDTLPGVSEQSLNGTWIYSHYEDETQEVLQELFGEESESQTEDENADIDRANVEIEILNGSGENEKLTELIGNLEEKGYSVTKTGNTSNTNTTTIINRSGVNEAIQSEIKEIVGKDNLVEGEEGTVDITIILGNDN